MNVQVRPTQPVVLRDGSNSRPLWEQTHFVLAVRQVFLASRAEDDEAFWATVEEALEHVRLEGRARWVGILGIDEQGSIAGHSAVGISLTTLDGRRVDGLGLPDGLFAGARAVHRARIDAIPGPLSLLGDAHDEIAVVPLYSSTRAIGIAIAAVDRSRRGVDTWLAVFADLVAWTMKGRCDGGAVPGLGLPSITEVAAEAPDALWMAHALDLADAPLAVSPFPGVMSYVNRAAQTFMSATGVEDYATDLDPLPNDDVDELAWRAQTMIAVVADPAGAGRQVVRPLHDGRDSEGAIRFESCLIRDPVTAAIQRSVMTIHPVPRPSTPTGSNDLGEALDINDGDAHGRAATHRQFGPDGGRPLELTERQWQVARRLARGDRPAMIASDLGLSIFTVRGHISSLYRLTGAADLPALIAGLRSLAN